MDLGIAGRKALVCAASKGLGRGCAEALAQAGVDVTILARTRNDVEKAAAGIVRYRSSPRHADGTRESVGTADGHLDARSARTHSGRAVWNAGGIRRDMRVLVQRSRRLHRRSERADRRRRVPRDFLMIDLYY